MNRLQYLLLKLAEECSEVSQIASKSMQFGLEGKHPALEKNNKERLHEELNDLNGILLMLNLEFGFNYEPNEEAMKAKADKVNHYYRYSKERGMVKNEQLN